MSARSVPGREGEREREFPTLLVSQHIGSRLRIWSSRVTQLNFSALRKVKEREVVLRFKRKCSH